MVWWSRGLLAAWVISVRADAREVPDASAFTRVRHWYSDGFSHRDRPLPPGRRSCPEPHPLVLRRSTVIRSLEISPEPAPRSRASLRSLHTLEKQSVNER